MEVSKNRNYVTTSVDEEIEVQRADVFSMLCNCGNLNLLYVVNITGIYYLVHLDPIFVELY